MPWLEMPDAYGYAVRMSEERTWRDSPTGLRAIKTHLPYTPEARYIWVARDPKDVFVSSYHFMRSTVLGPLMPSVERWLHLFLSEHAYTVSWAEHVDGGWRRRNDDNVLFLSYEQMKADLRGTVERIAAFMSVDLVPAELEDVVMQSTYDFMKSAGHKFDTRGLSPPWTAPRGAMVRRGEHGSAAELLSPADQRRIDDYWRAGLVKLGSDFPAGATDVRSRLRRGGRGLAPVPARRRHDGPGGARRQIPTVARQMAATLYRNRPDNDVPFDDYFQLASLGLLEALMRFDETQGVAFTTFANYRIKGAVLNGLDSPTERRDQAAFVRRNRLQRVESLRERPSDKDAAFRSMVDLTIELAIGFLMDDSRVAEPIGTDAPFELRAFDELRAAIGNAIDELPPRERLIVRYHYFHFVGFGELAERLNVSKGRVSQIHKRALGRIREVISGRGNLDDYY